MAQPTITMYVREDCSDVELARHILRRHSLTWDEIDIDKDLEAQRQVKEWTGGRAATPVLWIGDAMLIEPRPGELEAALESHEVTAPTGE